MNISKINILFCVLNEFFSDDEFVFIHWIEKFNVWRYSSIESRFRCCSWDHLWMICDWWWIWSSCCCSHIYCRCYALLNNLWHHFSNDRLNHLLHILIESLRMLIRHICFIERWWDYEMRRFFMIFKSLWITNF